MKAIVTVSIELKSDAQKQVIKGAIEGAIASALFGGKDGSLRLPVKVRVRSVDID
jgi:hypothetical protein